jgi:hypothetical protein
MEHIPDVAPPLSRSRQVRHRAREAARKPLGEELQFGMIRGGRNAARIESELAGLRLNGLRW